MNRNDVIRRIVERETQRLALTPASVRQDTPELYRTACKLFGTWETALQYAGVNLRRISIQQTYTREHVLHRIALLVRNKYNLQAGANRRRDHWLYMAALQYFGSWYKALLAAGIVQKRPRAATNRKWDRQTILAAIEARHQECKPMHYAGVQEDDNRLLDAARRYFGSWDNALTAAGVESERRVRRRTAKKG